MVQLSCKIKINNYIINSVVEVEVESSYLTLTDQSTIRIPRLIKFEGKTISADSLFKRGDEIEVELGYNFKNTLIFKGFIEEIKNGTVITLICTDSYNLKKGKNSKTYRKAKLDEVLKDNLDIDFQAVDADLGNIRIDKLTPLQILDFLNKNYGIKGWFRDGKLYSGLAFIPELQKEHQIIMNGNDSLIIDSDLEFKNEDEIFINCKAISIQADNTKIEVEVGDEEGENRTLHFFNITNKSTLKKLAEDKLKGFKYSGYRGSFITFGFTPYNHGDIIKLIDPKFQERTGKYIIEKVTTNFGQSGYRQTVYISSKV